MTRVNMSRLRILLFFILLLIISVGIIQPSFYIVSPGETRPATELLEINEQPRTGNEDTLFYTTVYAKPTSWGGAFSALFERDQAVLLERQLLNGVPIEQFQKNVEMVMEQSAYTALTAAYEYLNISYSDGTAALYIHRYKEEKNDNESFQHGDKMIALKRADGYIKVGDASILLETIKSQLEYGKVLTFVVERNEQIVELIIDKSNKASPNTERELLDWMGISSLTTLVTPIAEREEEKLTVGSTEVGGASAGLVMALTMIEELKPNTVQTLLPVAATGTISADGQIGRIGSLEQKVVSVHEAGIALFLVPLEQENEAQKKAKSIDSALTIKGVSTLAEAITFINMYNTVK